MTVHHLWSTLLKHVKDQGTSNLSEYKGKTVGVDAQIWLHQICQENEFSFAHSVLPFYPPESFLAAFKYRVNVLRHLGIKPLICFDGSDHIMKSVARETRNKDLSTAQARLDSLLEKGRSGETLSREELHKVKSYMKKTTKPSLEMVEAIVSWLKEESIDCICAPFESEWQLAYLEKTGEIDGIITRDGDVVVLGAKNVLLDVNLVSLKYLPYVRDIALDRTAIPVGKSCTFDLSASRDVLPEVAGLLGCDYIANIPQQGAVKVLKDGGLLELYLSVDDKTKAFDGIADCPPEHYKRLENTANLFRYCPVYNEQNNQLVPLNHYSGSSDTWGDDIGFGAHPLEAISEKARSNLKGSYRFEGASFRTVTGDPLPKYPSPRLYEEKHNPAVSRRDPPPPLPRFAEIDFDYTPLKACPNEILYLYLAAHGVTSIEKSDRDAIEKAVVDANHLVVPPSQVPAVISKWSVLEALDPISGEDWSNDYWHAVKGLKRIGRTDVSRFFPDGNENTRNRAQQLFEGGNFDVARLQCRLCFAKSDGSPKILFRCKCVPSMKSAVVSANEEESGREDDAYTVYLCFDYSVHDVAKRVALPYPYSCCGCYDGRGFCSHMLGFLMVLMAVQELPSQELFEDLMPESPLITQSTAMLIEFLTIADSYNRSKGYKKRKH